MGGGVTIPQWLGFSPLLFLTFQTWPMSAATGSVRCRSGSGLPSQRNWTEDQHRQDLCLRHRNQQVLCGPPLISAVYSWERTSIPLTHTQVRTYIHTCLRTYLHMHISSDADAASRLLQGGCRELPLPSWASCGGAPRMAGPVWTSGLSGFGLQPSHGVTGFQMYRTCSALMRFFGFGVERLEVQSLARWKQMQLPVHSGLGRSVSARFGHITLKATQSNKIPNLQRLQWEAKRALRAMDSQASVCVCVCPVRAKRMLLKRILMLRKRLCYLRAHDVEKES